MHAARHQIIARALGRWLRENWCLDLEKTALVEVSTRGLLKTMAKHEVLLELGPAQIEMSVTEPELFRRQLFALSPRVWNRRCFCRLGRLNRRRLEHHS